MSQVIALGDPHFPNMEDWLNRSDDIEKNKLNAPQAHVSLRTKVITISVSAVSDSNQMDAKQDKLETYSVTLLFTPNWLSYPATFTYIYMSILFFRPFLQYITMPKHIFW